MGLCAGPARPETGRGAFASKPGELQTLGGLGVFDRQACSPVSGRRTRLRQVTCDPLAVLPVRHYNQRSQLYGEG